MRTALTFFALFVLCLLVWALLVGAFAHFNFIPTRSRDSILTVLWFAVPAMFSGAMAIVAFRKAKGDTRLMRAMTAGLWASGFAVACWFACYYVIVPVYFYVGGGE